MLDTNNAPALADKPPAISAVLFDLDDTLWPIGPVIARAEQLLFDWLTGNAPVVARHFSIDSLHQRRMELARLCCDKNLRQYRPCTISAKA